VRSDREDCTRLGQGFECVLGPGSNSTQSEIVSLSNSGYKKQILLLSCKEEKEQTETESIVTCHDQGS
jgi:hypothetical protein